MAETMMHLHVTTALRIGIAAVVGLLLMCGPIPALSASGGRMGGSLFPSSPATEKPSVKREDASSYSPPQLATEKPSVERKDGNSYSPPQSYFTPVTKVESNHWFWSTPPSNYAPPPPSYAQPPPSNYARPPPSYEHAAPAAAGSNTRSPSSSPKVNPMADFVVVISVAVAVMLMGLTAYVFWEEHERRKVPNHRVYVPVPNPRVYVPSPPREKTSVLKLQILGMLGRGRSVQKELNQIAETADTSTKNGIHNVLTETVVALLRHPEYFISAYTSVDVKSSLKEGEKAFQEQSITERVKFDEETLVNINNKQKRAPSAPMTEAVFASNEYIVITILVAARGALELPAIKNINELKEALRNLASIPLDSALAVEVLWTPQTEADTLSEQELLQDYPFLKPF